MILPDLIISEHAGKFYDYTGMDSPDKNLDRAWFKAYPYTVDYHYNERGFRDDPWSSDLDDLKKSTWCLGDSFTVGLGQPFEHTWWRQLQSDTGDRCINVSIDGASNDWICRRACQIIKHVNPSRMIIMWSFLHRREHADNSLSDLGRRMLNEDREISMFRDLDNWQQNIEMLLDHSQDVDLVQFLIPNATCDYDRRRDWDHVKGPDWPETIPKKLESLPAFIKMELTHKFDLWDKFFEIERYHDMLDRFRIHQVLQTDLARDGFHYGIETSRWVSSRAKADLGL